MVKMRIMKTIFFILLTVFALESNAQLHKSTLQASGLTCAMCSNAINKALQKIPFVATVKSDIKNSSFNIVFKENTKVNIDDLKKAVEDAGFSVAKLNVTGTFNNVHVKNDEHVNIDGTTFHFLKVNDQVLTGEKTLIVVDKNFLNSKEFKKYSDATKMSCLQTGKAASCCVKEGITANTRIYHVTI